MDEQILLNERGVIVSTARFVAPQATYALATVSSVRLAYEDVGGGRWLLVLLALSLSGMGIACLSISTAVGATGLLCAAILAYFAYKADPKRMHYLFVTTNSGEVPGLKDYDGAWIQRVHDALVQAIVARG